jgi:hypothetical protein
VKKKMLFMSIVSWEPEKRDAVVQRRSTEKIPEGLKLVGEWLDMNGCRSFRLFECGDDPMSYIAASAYWNDLCKIDSVPVIKSEDAFKLLPKMLDISVRLTKRSEERVSKANNF